MGSTSSNSNHTTDHRDLGYVIESLRKNTKTFFCVSVIFFIALLAFKLLALNTTEVSATLAPQHDFEKKLSHFINSQTQNNSIGQHAAYSSLPKKLKVHVLHNYTESFKSFQNFKTFIEKNPQFQSTSIKDVKKFKTSKVKEDTTITVYLKGKKLEHLKNFLSQYALYIAKKTEERFLIEVMKDFRRESLQVSLQLNMFQPRDSSDKADRQGRSSANFQPIAIGNNGSDFVFIDSFQESLQSFLAENSPISIVSEPAGPTVQIERRNLIFYIFSILVSIFLGLIAAVFKQVLKPRQT